jgi:hypothetical protein
MEHRHTKRELKEVHAKICFDDNSCWETSTQDISKHGLFLKLHELKLVANTIVRVVLPESETTLPWRTRAMVVHASNSGAGLLLEKDLPQGFYQDDRKKCDGIAASNTSCTT